MTRHRKETEVKKPFGLKKSAPVGYSSYEVIDSEFGFIAKSKKRNPRKAEGYSKRLLMAVDTDLIDTLEMQPGTIAEVVNGLVRYAMDELRKNKKMLNVVLNASEEK